MASYLATPSATRAVLERHGLLLKHRLGQNFLVNDAIIEKIIALAEPAAGEHVLEVGPGIGTLTVALLGSGASVTAIEADPTLPAVLAETCARDGEHLALIEGDALKVDLAALDPAPAKLVSNLPYQVAATIILKVFEDVPSFTRAVVMVQAEVADRIAAKPGSTVSEMFSSRRWGLKRLQGSSP